MSGRSTPLRSRWNLEVDDSPISGTIQFLPLRQVLEGRVKRRIRRNGLSEEGNAVEHERKVEKRAHQSKIAELQEELRRKDEELQRFMDAAEVAAQLGGLPTTPQSVSHTEVLERSITELQAQISFHESFHQEEVSSNASTHHLAGDGEEEIHNWTLAARDPWDDNTDTFMSDMDGLAEDPDVLASTPAHERQIRRSFSSPPDSAMNTPHQPACHIFRAVTPSTLATRQNVNNFAVNLNNNFNLGVNLQQSLEESLRQPVSHTGDTTVPNSPTLSAESVLNSPTISISTEAETEVLEGLEEQDQDQCVQLPPFQPANYRTTDTAIQTSFSLLPPASAAQPPPTHLETEEQIHELAGELETLQQRLELNTGLQGRLRSKLEPFVMVEGLGFEGCSEGEMLDFALDSVLTHLALAQEGVRDADGRFDALTKELINIFPVNGEGEQDNDEASGHKAEAVLTIIKSQFREARLDLERLFPGEQKEGFDNAKLLGMLTNRLKTLAEKEKEQEGEIDQYHSQELLLREQLGARVDATKVLQGMLRDAQATITRLEVDKVAGLGELKKALESYRREVQGLEGVIERLSNIHAKDRAELLRNHQNQVAASKEDGRQQLDLMREAAEDRISQEMDISITLRKTVEHQQALTSELESKLTSAQNAMNGLQKELRKITMEHATLSVQHHNVKAAHNALNVQHAECSTQYNVLAAEHQGCMSQWESLHTQAHQAVEERNKTILARESTVLSMHAELQTLTTALSNSQEEVQRLRAGLTKAHDTISSEKLMGRRLKGELRRVIEHAGLAGFGSDCGTPQREMAQPEVAQSGSHVSVTKHMIAQQKPPSTKQEWAAMAAAGSAYHLAHHHQVLQAAHQQQQSITQNGDIRSSAEGMDISQYSQYSQALQDVSMRDASFPSHHTAADMALSATLPPASAPAPLATGCPISEAKAKAKAGQIFDKKLSRRRSRRDGGLETVAEEGLEGGDKRRKKRRQKTQGGREEERREQDLLSRIGLDASAIR